MTRLERETLIAILVALSLPISYWALFSGPYLIGLVVALLQLFALIYLRLQPWSRSRGKLIGVYMLAFLSWTLVGLVVIYLVGQFGKGYRESA